MYERGILMKPKDASARVKPRIGRLTFPLLFCAAAVFSAVMVYADGSTRYPGDVNLDREIDVSDAVLIARFCAEDKTVTFTPEGYLNADTNSDNYINWSDLILLLKQIAKQLPMPPNPYIVTETPRRSHLRKASRRPSPPPLPEQQRSLKRSCMKPVS